MSLYDDFDKEPTTEKVAGWSSGIKLLQSQLQLKKAAVTQPKREQLRKNIQTLPPVIDLKTKKNNENEEPLISPLSSLNFINQFSAPFLGRKSSTKKITSIPTDYLWDYEFEYDPQIPNEYDKVSRDLRLMRERESEQNIEEKEKKRSDKKRKSRFSDDDEPNSPKQTQEASPRNNTGFCAPWNEEELEESSSTPRSGGVAIAPPPSLQEDSLPDPQLSNLRQGPLAGISYGATNASSVAAKIMAKYGFKEGQGLGKKEQGMSIALQVEKTSKRGGRIIHEKEMMPPPPPAFISPLQANENSCNSPSTSTNEQPSLELPKPEPSITEIMKNPSKIVLLRNMVGPGEVDNDLEPEVKDECNSKYGDVIKVIIYEIKSRQPDEAVRIFVEFKRMESAIKAVVDLNGRFFGGRQVKASFYSVEKFNNLQLLD